MTKTDTAKKLDELARLILRYRDGDVLLGCSPYGRRSTLLLVKRHAEELSRATGMKVTYYGSNYVPSGNGPFGRYGSKRGTYNSAWIYIGK